MCSGAVAPLLVGPGSTLTRGGEGYVQLRLNPAGWEPDGLCSLRKVWVLLLGNRAMDIGLPETADDCFLIPDSFSLLKIFMEKITQEPHIFRC